MAGGDNRFREECFLANDGDQYYELSPASQSQKRITAQVVKRAVIWLLVKEAQYPEKLFFGAIHLLWKRNEKKMVGSTK